MASRICIEDAYFSWFSHIRALYLSDRLLKCLSRKRAVEVKDIVFVNLLKQRCVPAHYVGIIPTPNEIFCFRNIIARNMI